MVDSLSEPEHSVDVAPGFSAQVSPDQASQLGGDCSDDGDTAEGIQDGSIGGNEGRPGEAGHDIGAGEAGHDIGEK